MRLSRRRRSISRSSASLLVARKKGCKQHSILNEQQFRGRLLLDRAKGSHVVCCREHVTDALDVLTGSNPCE
jgi:hypothetical protein